MKRAGVLLAILASSACAPSELPERGQVLIHVDTDAPVPRAFGQQIEIDEPIPLFDTLRVDVYEPNDPSPCDGCSRSFALDQERFSTGQVSFGVPAAEGVDGYRVRLRMYPSRATRSGEPPEADAAGNPPQSVVEAIVSLPVTSEGVVSRTVFLATDSVGVPAGSLDAPIETSAGAPGSSRVGTWSAAERVSCAGEPEDGEVCIPGGAFWMGNAKVVGQGLGDAADRLRLVVLSPFFLDSDEVTIARARAAGLEPDYEWSGETTGFGFEDFCTYTPEPMGREDVPLNCASWAKADAFCKSKGADLPTEAQYEWVASAFEGRLYVWGEDDPKCEDAVLGQAGWGLLSSFIAPCKPDEPPGSPLIVGSLVDPPRRDRLEVPGGAVYDLVGNMCEFVRDTWNRQDEPCWSAPGAHVDPVCQTESEEGFQRTYRGGCWDINARLSTSASRQGIGDDTTVGLIGLGFRCARAGSP